MLSDYQALVPNLVRDDAGKLVAGDFDRVIELAVQRYSKDRPRDKVEDLTPDSANLLPLPAAWSEGFSEILAIEYPIGSVPPTITPQDRYGLYRTPASHKIQLLDGVAVAAFNNRVTFTVKHIVSAIEDTIPVEDREPVACWAAAISCDELAALYSGNTDSTIQADTVQSTTKAQEYAARARSLRKRYLDELGIDDKRATPAGVVVNLDFPASDGGDRLTHGRAVHR